MYFTVELLKIALEQLKPYHPFFGLTFLVFKKGKLPQGRSIDFAIGQHEKAFLNKYYKPNANVDAYYRVMRANQPNKAWNSFTYASTGSQKTRTQGAFASALIHDHDTAQWGWNKNYVDILRNLLYRNQAISIFYLAVWLYRDEDWSENTTPEQVIEKFVKEFSLKRFESALFSSDMPQDIQYATLFRDTPLTWNDLKQIIDPFDGNGLQGKAAAIIALAQNNRPPVPISYDDLTDSQIEILFSILPSEVQHEDLSRLLNGILYSLKTGCAWDDMPEKYGSPTTYLQVFSAWVEQGVWGLIWQTLFRQLDAEEKLTWIQAFLIGNFVPAKK